MILDLIYPPLCLACNEVCRTKFLCLECWKLCTLCDPIERCRHCFQILEYEGNFCKQCQREKKLIPNRAFVFDPESPAHFLDVEAVDAMASFAYIQWIALDWPVPNGVISMPDKESKAIGKVFAEMVGSPFIKAINRQLDCAIDLLDDEGEWVLFDVSNELTDLQKVSLSLIEAFPKKIYILSLLPYVDRFT